VNLGNAEIDSTLFFALAKYFNVEMREDEAEVYLQADKEHYTPREVTKIAHIIGNLKPDECELKADGMLRLWWD
jgi:hypothetical protein